jgi:hypothetical protein
MMRNKMKTNIGIWIDHRKAVIAHASDKEMAQVIRSDAERHLARINGEQSGAPFETWQVIADDVQQRKLRQHLDTYYDEVIALVHEADALLIFGPGEAKGELGKRLEKEKPSGRFVAVVTADKMTNRQIAAQVRDHFRADSPVILL